jgi:CubicO group peptidase (beta-lactamase class C family)
MNATHSLPYAISRADAFPAGSLLHSVRNAGARLAAPAFHYRLLSAERVIADCFSGYRNVEQRLPATPDTQYALFSVTKTFTAAAVLQASEAGRLHLNAAAADYLPQYGCLGKITLRQLLAHQSGLGNPLPLRWIHPAPEQDTFHYKQFVAAVLRKAKGSGKPGEKTAYSNLNYLVLGEILEKVSDRPYRTLVESDILRKVTGDPRLGFHWQSADQATGYHPARSLSGLLLGWLLDKRTYTYPASRAWTGFRPFYTNGLAYGGLLGLGRTAGPVPAGVVARQYFAAGGAQPPRTVRRTAPAERQAGRDGTGMGYGQA